MCKYCDADSLKKMRDEVDAILSEDYSGDTEDRLSDALESHAIFTIWGWEGGIFYFLDGTSWDEDRFTKWNNNNFTYCPVCGKKIER